MKNNTSMDAEIEAETARLAVEAATLVDRTRAAKRLSEERLASMSGVSYATVCEALAGVGLMDEAGELNLREFVRFGLAMGVRWKFEALENGAAAISTEEARAIAEHALWTKRTRGWAFTMRESLKEDACGEIERLLGRIAARTKPTQVPAKKIERNSQGIPRDEEHECKACGFHFGLTQHARVRTHTVLVQAIKTKEFFRERCSGSGKYPVKRG